jgi:protein-disulfide isomerase/uncharacterized membrane protein
MAAETAPTATTPTTPAARPHRAWALWLLVPILLVAAGVSVYMTRHHETQLYGGPAYQGEKVAGCEEAAGVSCDVVNTSDWSELFGVPLFTWGLGFYLAAIAVVVLAARGQHKLKPLLVAMGVGATAYSVFLYWISVEELKHVCLWCMRLYGMNAALLVLSAASGVTRNDLPSSKDLGVFAGIFALTTGVAVGGQKVYRGQLLSAAPTAGGLTAASDVKEISLAQDPKGDAPVLSFSITTEDGTPATLTTGPGDAWKGNPKAKVAVVEFADFECGYCKRTGFELRRLYEKYKNDVVFIFKHFPMDPQCNPGVANKKHADACNAAAASVCAQQQGRFWAMHDLMFKNNHQLRPDNLIAYAEKAGLDKQGFLQCMQEKKGVAKVQADGEVGKTLAIHGTPRIWINGQLYRSGSSAEQMAAAIEIALGHSAEEARTNAAAMKETASAVEEVRADTPEMRLIEAGGKRFYIDSFEAGVTDGKATSAKHQIPGIRMSWFTAETACKAAGKRMCSEEEWIVACQGQPAVDDDGNGKFADDMIEGNAYPYGDFHEKGRCWENHPNQGGAPGAPPTWRPVYTGEMPGCVTSTGVYDLTGNVEEWVGTSADKAVLLGGGFDTPDDKARCYRRNDTFAAGYANLRTGFRCCKDAP